MTGLAVAALGVFVLAVAPALAGARRLGVENTARLSITSLGAAWVLVVGGLFVTAAPLVTVASGPGGDSHSCGFLFGHDVPSSVSVVAAGLLVSIIVRTHLGLRRARRLRTQACPADLFSPEAEYDGESVIVLPVETPLAYSVNGRIVVSRGLTEEVGDDIDSVLAHEAAHVRFGHERLTLAAHALVSGLSPLPGARRCATDVQRLCEAWADDAAAARTGARGVMRALSRLRLRAGEEARIDIDTRLRALALPARRSRPAIRRLICGLGAGFVSVAIVVGSAAAADAHSVVDAVGLCGF